MTTFRVYFNLHEDYPLVWSYDTGDKTEECTVESVTISGYARTVYRGKDDHTQPRAWIEIRGAVFRREDHVYFIGR